MAAYIRVPPCPPHHNHQQRQPHQHHHRAHTIETTASVFEEDQRHRPIRVETYEWVNSQGQYRPRHKTNKAEKWVRTQQEYSSLPPADKMYMGRPEVLARVLDSYDAEARRYKRLQHEMKKTVENMERERQKYKEHILASKLLWKQEEEERRRRRAAAAAAAVTAEERTPLKEERVRHISLSFEDAFQQYEDGWQELAKSSTPITFQDIPWPVLHKPRDPSDITPAQIASFLLSSNHSPQLSRKDRIRNAQLRWHPDRFRRLMERVVDEDKEAIESGAGNIARALNDLAAESPRRRSHTS